jgi:ceramide glucosyltransferase
VNQLVTLARAARHEILVVSDSNVRVPRSYLSGIAAHLEDARVGLVTHLVAGQQEESLGSVLDSLHLAGGIAPSVAAAKWLASRDLVVGKSMALRRRDLEALGGFAAVKDVLAEDYVLGHWIGSRLRRRVVLAHEPIVNVTRSRTVEEFVSRYGRWAVMQRRIAGTPTYGAGVLLNPTVLAAAAAVADPTWRSFAAWCAVCSARIALDAGCGLRLRPGGFSARQLGLVPLKDVLFAVAWTHGLLSDHVMWRGKRIRVLEGTRISASPLPDATRDDARAAGAL